MSVLRIPVRVMKTLIVRTVTVLTGVLVNRDSLEMAQLVMVGVKFVSYPVFMSLFEIISRPYLLKSSNGDVSHLINENL